MPISRRDALKYGTTVAIGLAPALRHCCAIADDAVKPASDDWPWWRGPTWDGHAVGELPPLKWSESKNIVWKIPVPGLGHSTPCLYGDRVFLTTADEEEQVQSLICLRRADGRKLWQTAVHTGGFVKKHKKNTHASATPATDGKHVFTIFYRDEEVWATAVELDGRIAWQKKVGHFNDRYGYGSSPTIYKSSLIVAGDSPGDGFLAALDRKTGEETWRTERPKLTSYGAPVVATIGGRVQLILQGNQVAGHDPRDGSELWHCEAPARATACSLCFDGSHVYASGGYPERRVYGIRAGDGKSSEAEIVWRCQRRSAASYVPTPILVEGRLYIVSDGGLANCLQASDGEELWSQRLGGNFSASPVLIGDTLIAPNEAGRTYVFKAGAEYQPVAENALDDGIFASPIVCGGRLYLRTTRHLYCIGG